MRLAYFDRPRTSHGPTEAINGRLEHLRGSIVCQIKRDNEAKSALANDLPKIAARATCDYITSLTEVQAVELHGRLFGHTRSSMLHGWMRT